MQSQLYVIQCSNYSVPRLFFFFSFFCVLTEFALCSNQKNTKTCQHFSFLRKLWMSIKILKSKKEKKTVTEILYPSPVYLLRLFHGLDLAALILGRVEPLQWQPRFQTDVHLVVTCHFAQVVIEFQQNVCIQCCGQKNTTAVEDEVLRDAAFWQQPCSAWSQQQQRHFVSTEKKLKLTKEVSSSSTYWHNVQHYEDSRHF